MSKKTAMYVGAPPYEVLGVVEIFQVDPPINGSSLVLFSTVNNGGGLMGMGDWISETAMFVCDEDFEVSDWSDPIRTDERLHATTVLADLGYEIVK